MNNKYEDIGDDEIQVLGKLGPRQHYPATEKHPTPKKRKGKVIAIVAGIIGLLLLLFFLFLRPRMLRNDLTSPEPGY